MFDVTVKQTSSVKTTRVKDERTYICSINQLIHCHHSSSFIVLRVVKYEL